MRHLLTGVLVVGSLATCAMPIDPDPQDANYSRIEVCAPGVAGDLEQIEIVVDPPALPDDRAIFEAPGAQAAPGLPCECADPRCLARWIDEHMGCGVCAHVRCGDGMTGACVPCDSGLSEDPWCVLPPSGEVAR